MNLEAKSKIGVKIVDLEKRTEQKILKKITKVIRKLKVFTV